MGAAPRSAILSRYVRRAEAAGSVHFAPARARPERRQSARAGRPPRDSSAQKSVLIPIGVFVVTRLYLLVLGRIAARLVAPLHRYPVFLPRTDPLARFWDWSSPWFRFDARWYVDVAEHGYRYGAIDVTNTNFFPLYPLLIRVIQPVAGGSPWVSAWVVSNAAFLLALIALWRWAGSRWGDEVALRVILLVACFPFAFFFAAPYAEPVFLACAVASFWRADADQWWSAAVFAGLATIARPVGVAVVAAIVVLALFRRSLHGAAIGSFAILPFLGFVAIMWKVTGHPLAFTVYHTAGWVAPRGGILHTISSQFDTGISPFDRVDAAVSALFLVSAIAVWRRLGPAYAVFVLLGALLPLVRSLAGMERYVIVLFPVPATWALWKNPLGQAVVFSLSLTLLAGATCLFAAGYALF